ncbi:Phosphate acetyltransferase [hydrothermal vent metagenome]|uniref:Phosphate acetyltransferase n=1 Tax=hydrothermal vent metagenome TaxID=652676 RepID=A0A3B0XBW8_9ZZZZ
MTEDSAQKMPLKNCPHLKQIIKQAQHFPALPVAVVNAEESHVLEGMMEARQQGLVDPVLIGDADMIHSLCQQLDFQLGDTQVIHAQTEAEAVQLGIDLVKNQQAMALAKGWIHTDALMRPVLSQLRTHQRVSHVFVTELSSYPKLLFITDAAININPDLKIKAKILQNAINLARLLGIKRPKVAALSAVEVVKPEIVSTLDAACLSKMAERGQIEHAIVDGPLAFDNAISSEAAGIKHIQSSVAGDVDILLAPDLNAANILAKDLEYLAGATLAGVVVGAEVPILLPSRSDPPQARLVAAALAVLMHHSKQTTTMTSTHV